MSSKDTICTVYFPPPSFFSSPVVYSEQVNKLSIHSKSPGDFTCGGKIKKKKKESEGGQKKKMQKMISLQRRARNFPAAHGRIFSDQNIPYGKKRMKNNRSL